MPPTLEADLLPRSQPVGISIALEPAHNALNSLLLLHSDLSGLDDWVNRTAARLSPEQLHRNRLVTEGLYHATLPVRRWPSFSAYVDDLAACDPNVLRDRLMWNITHHSKRAPISGAMDAQLADPQVLLSSVGEYLAFFRAHL